MTRHASHHLAIGLALLGVVACRGVARGDGRTVESLQARSKIQDYGGMFDPSSAEKARPILEEVARSASVPILIETIDSLRGQSVEEASLKRAMQSGREGLFVLLARDEKKIEVRASRRFKAAIDDNDVRRIRDAFVSALREDPRRAIEPGVEAIATVLREAMAKHELPGPDAHGAGDGGGALVVRNQVRLTLAGARRIIEGAEAKAAEMGLKVNIAVVDDGGHLLSFARMDGARPASGYTATTKAITAATFRQESGPLPRGGTTPDLLLNLSLQNAAAASGGKLTTLHGGVPVTVEEQVIGGVGVGGGTGEQDAIIAKAGIQSFMTLLSARPGPAAAHGDHAR